MQLITVSVFAILVLFGIVLSAETEMPQVVYIHYSTQEEAEEAQKKILAEYEGATIVMGDDPSLSVANITAPLTETVDTSSEKPLEPMTEDSQVATSSSTTTEASKDSEDKP